MKEKKLCPRCKKLKSSDCYYHIRLVSGRHKNNIRLDAYCKQCSKKYTRDKRRIGLVRKKAHLRQCYQINLDEFLWLISFQNNKCALCESEFVNTPHIDHQHDKCQEHLKHKRSKVYGCKKCIRGLLCLRCNAMIGLVEEFPRLQNEIIKEYLSRRPFYGNSN